MPTRKWSSGVGMDKEYGVLLNELVRAWDIAHDHNVQPKLNLHSNPCHGAC